MNRTQEEVIKVFEEKQASAEREIERARAKDCELTPLEKDTKIIKNKAYMEAYEDCIAVLRGCTIVEKEEPKHFICPPPGEDESQALREPLCTKCSKTKETCPFHRIGSAYEDCSGFESLFNEETNEAMIPKADITKDKIEGVWVLYSGVITEKDDYVYIDDGTKVYCFPKYSTTRDKDLKYYYQENKPSEDVGVDMPKLQENTPKSNSDKYIEELLNDNTKLQNELSQCKDTIVELANEVTTYRKVARDREV